MIRQGYEVSWLLDCLLGLCVAVFECAAELGVCGVESEFLGYWVDYAAGDGVSLCVYLGAQDEAAEAEDGEE